MGFRLRFVRAVMFTADSGHCALRRRQPGFAPGQPSPQQGRPYTTFGGALLKAVTTSENYTSAFTHHVKSQRETVLRVCTQRVIIQYGL